MKWIDVSGYFGSPSKVIQLGEKKLFEYRLNHHGPIDAQGSFVLDINVNKGIIERLITRKYDG